MVMTVVLFTILLGLGGVHNREVRCNILDVVGEGRALAFKACGMLMTTPGYIIAIPLSILDEPMATAHPAYTIDHTDTVQDTLEHDAPARKWRTRACTATAQEDDAKLPPRYARAKRHGYVL
jgi:hypothetical protein